MDELQQPRIVSAERVNGGILITYEDGVCAFYSEILLHSIVSQAEQVSDSDFDQ